MLKKEVKIGSMYTAKISNQLTTVRVEEIGERYFSVLNLATNRGCTIKSAQKLRKEVKPEDYSGNPLRPFAPRVVVTPNVVTITPEEARKLLGYPEPEVKKCDQHAACQATTNEPGEVCDECGGIVPAREVPVVTEPGECDACGEEVVVHTGKDGVDLHSCGCGMDKINRTTGERVPTVAEVANRPFAHTTAPAVAVQANPTATTGTLAATVSKTMVIPAADTPPTAEMLKTARDIYDPSAAGTTPKPGGFLSRLGQNADNSPHLIVEARAGTGKTTTLVCALQVLQGHKPHVMVYVDPARPGMGKKPLYITPSEQQQAVFDAVALSRGKVKTICFVAFNKAIAVELQERVPQGVEAMTMHSMGFRAVRNAFPRVDAGDRGKWLVTDIICELLGTDARALRKEKFPLLKAVEDLVSKCKMNLTEPTLEGLNELVDYYDIELDKYRSEVFRLVPLVLERCKDVARNGRINFDDMIWLPVVLGLNVTKYDLLLVDEAQDLNRCQQALAKMAGKRLILCGDPKQAIYGFAGADAESMPRLNKELSANGRGCTHLPLTVTRRCGKAIVAEANRYVSDFEAFHTNPEGKIHNRVMRKKGYVPHTVEQDAQNYMSWVLDGDFILCRVNAPLISECFKFLKAGRKANIQGRDVGAGLISTINKLKASSIADLMAKLSDWLHRETEKEQAKRMPSENRIQAIQDRYDCIVCFTENMQTVEAVVRRIEEIFTDNKTSPGIKLSSIHKAKGLEARRVFILMKTLREDKMQAWECDQEDNLRYVAITRAIEELTYVQMPKEGGNRDE